MSHCVSFGKDKVMFLTEEDLKSPSSIILPELEEPRGAFLPNGEINWECPCLGNAAIGPCSVEFREAFTCLQGSTASPKGSECIPKFREMSDCMTRHPYHYPSHDQGADNALKSLEEDQKEMEQLEENVSRDQQEGQNQQEEK